ncbi:MAG: hypothetical protein PHF56_15020 [Desulfuromonadaceae bacterium]|nr:hypothetical protein [Desulfuromonadaceae bacterium]
MTETTPAKRLIIPVHDNSEFFSDNADYAIIDLDAATIERIKKLSVVVKQMKAYRISEFNYVCNFMTADWDAEPDNGKVRLKEFVGRIECNTLNVTDSDFFWSGLYKHTDIRWETDTVPLAVFGMPDVHDKRETCTDAAGQGDAP